MSIKELIRIITILIVMLCGSFFSVTYAIEGWGSGGRYYTKNTYDIFEDLGMLKEWNDFVDSDADDNLNDIIINGGSVKSIIKCFERLKLESKDEFRNVRLANYAFIVKKKIAQLVL